MLQCDFIYGTQTYLIVCNAVVSVIDCLIHQYLSHEIIKKWTTEYW